MEFQGPWNLIVQDKVGGIPQLTITKQKHLIDLLVPRMSSPSIMSRYMFNITCFLSIEVWKILQSDWLRKLLAKCKNSGKSKKFRKINAVVHTQTGKQRADWTDRKGTFHRTTQHYTQVQQNK